MINLKIFSTVALAIIILSCSPHGKKVTEGVSREVIIPVSKKYLNFPISQNTPRAKMKLETDSNTLFEFLIRLAAGKPDYWVFYDVSDLKGRTIKINYAGDPSGLKKIYQDDVIAGQDSLYRESNRPQIHFTSRRGWNNDPNGLVFYEGEYHLYYQHNPFEREWENMSWGHAVSKDLIDWQELPLALIPDSMGTMFSGSAVIDKDNTSGFGKNDIPPLVVIYTVDNPERERQCIAYSLDNGRTFTKYEGNPVIDSWSKWKTKDLRDPAVFWYEPDKNWIMVLYEKDGNSIYTSRDLKDWTYQSHITGFFECPQLFELAVDNNKNNKKWVMYGGSGIYMIGSFDGKTFQPESGKHYYGNGVFYAAQTYNNIPASDERRIQIGWGRVDHPDMPFKSMMLLPTELTLKTTREGVRLFSKPVKEVGQLEEKEIIFDGSNQDRASEFLQQFNKAASLRLKFTLKLTYPTSAGLSLFGQNILLYDMNNSQVNGLFYSPEDMTSLEIDVDLILDKTSVEAFIDDGAFSYAIERKAVPGNKVGFKFFGKEVEIKNLKVYPLKSIWGN